MRKTQELLQKLVETYPPPGNSSHYVQFWDGKLEVTILGEFDSETIVLEDEDLDKDVDSMFTELVQVYNDLKSKGPTTSQSLQS